jgi:hypothetical protein
VEGRRDEVKDQEEWNSVSLKEIRIKYSKEERGRGK